MDLGLVERRAERLDGRLHARRVEGAGDIERSARLPRSRAASSAFSSASRSPERTTWPGALSLATVTRRLRPIGFGVLEVGADERQHRAVVVGLGHQLAAQDDEFRASSRSSTPAAASAASSPSEWPAAARGVEVERVPAGEAGAEDGGLGEAGGLADAGKGSSPTSAVQRSSRSGARSATRSRISGVWLPWPGNSATGAAGSVIKLTRRTCPRVSEVTALAPPPPGQRLAPPPAHRGA